MKKYEDPTRYLFNDEDREYWGDRYWRCPVRLVLEGTWASLWRESNVVTSLLPILALHGGSKLEEGEWTKCFYVSRRRLEKLAGVNKDTVGVGLNALKRLGLLQETRVPGPEYQGGYRLEYRLRGDLYPDPGEPYVEFHGILFYGGTWSILPASSMRHLYVVVACADPIHNEEAYVERLVSTGASDLYDDDARDEINLIARVNHPRSLRELEELSGMSRSTVIKARNALLVNIAEGQSLVTMGFKQTYDGDTWWDTYDVEKAPRWHAINFKAKRLWWRPQGLNDPSAVAAKRAKVWPDLGPGRRRHNRVKVVST